MEDTRLDQTPRNFGELLKLHRGKNNLTQEQLRVKLECRGYNLGKTTISMWERGKRVPNDSSVFHHLGKCLHLTNEQEAALLNACIADMTLRYIQPYYHMQAE